MAEQKFKLIKWLRSHRRITVPVIVMLILLAGYIYMNMQGGEFERSDSRHGSLEITTPQNGEELEKGEDLLPENAGTTAGSSPEAEPELTAEQQADLNSVYGVIARGDTVSNLLQAWLGPQEITTLAAVCKSVHPLNQIKIGQPYAVFTRNEEFVSFEYEIDANHKLTATRNAQGFEAALVNIEYEIKLHRVHGEIRSNLFNAMSDAGEQPVLAAALADVFAWEINFIRDLREGDRFVLLVEKRYRNGEFKGYGKLLAAFFENQLLRYEAFLFREGNGQSQYYTQDGQSVRRSFLKAPLSFTRISSGYSNNRLHPVTMDWKAHPAIDYAAPTGTPVKTVGNGTVIFVGYSKSAGNYIRISHPNDYETMYLHLSGFAKGLRKNDKVVQGQVIGFVGKTGYATGPHLDFRMKKEGRYVNPLGIKAERDTPVSQAEMPAFLQQVQAYIDFLNSVRTLTEYRREEFKI
ncbi:peptidoglycan DD-metalloendopeptidase family protein [Desulfovibrio sp. OttesenSCG-928-F07]|nr:peptidoglycan DD-metalloendopeptidase family protein [Desulfovibrio sp. OttesenSCG-928-F07]